MPDVTPKPPTSVLGTIKLPGILWVILLVGATWAINRYFPDQGLLTLLVMIVPIVARMLAPEDARVEALIEIALNLLRHQPPVQRNVKLVGSEGSNERVVYQGTLVSAEDILKYRRNHLVKKLVG